MDKFPEAFERFERSGVDISDVEDNNGLLRKFRYWLNRGTTWKQKVAIRREARRLGIKVIVPVERHYTFHEVRGRTVMVARIPKGQKGAGRFAKRY